MSDKNKFPNQSSLLDKWSKKEASSLSSGLSLTSSLLSGNTSLLKGSDALQQGSQFSSKATVGTSPSLSGSYLQSTNLTNSLLGSYSLQSNLDFQLTTKSNLSLTPTKSLSSTKPSLNLGTDLTSGLKASKQLLIEPSQCVRSGFTSSLKPGKAQPIESSLLKLSLAHSSQNTTKGITFSDTKTSLRDDTLDLKGHAQKRHIGTSVKTVKKNKVESSSGVVTAQVIKEYAVEPPDYFIKYEKEDEYMEVEFPKFIPPSKDLRLTQAIGKSLTEIFSIKRGLINCISASLISQPNFTNSMDPTRISITDHVHTVINYDPEFILKVALYSRKELNIRTTSNFLLALAANTSSCRIFLKKYFCASIALPSDWIEVAQIFQTLDDNSLKRGGLPSALRKAMITKFPEFDKYQLAKYNKESSNKKKKAKGKKLGEREEKKQKGNKKVEKRRLFDSDTSENEEDTEIAKQISSVSYEEKESEETLRKQRFTIKQLIRKLHIREPVEHIMCIIGKKYPQTPEEFYKTRLPGIWEEEKAGKRMKLPVPETWETQVSLKGNKAKTWEDLIDHKKLPFMAMLRNLRNLIRAGISTKHHNNVLRRLTDQKSVVNSKQFPFRFFSAYAALDELEKNYETNQREIIEAAEVAAMTAGFQVARVPNRYTPDDNALFVQVKSKVAQRRERVRQARAMARRGARGLGRGRGGVRGIGRGGVRGIGRGRGGVRGIGRARGGATGTSTATDADAAEPFPWWILKKMKKAEAEGGTMKEVAYDLNLIQRYRKALDTAVKIATVHNVQPIKGRTLLICERRNLDKPCYSARGLGKPRTACEIAILMGLMCKYSCEECEMLVVDNGFTSVDLDKGTILDNMEKVMKLKIPIIDQNENDNILPYSVLLEKLRDRIQVDNLLIFGENFDPDSQKGREINSWLRSYRHLVNPNLLFVSVNFSSSKVGVVTDIQPEHDNDIYIAGYSDSILRFIAERGNAGQVNHVDKIDLAFQLRPIAKVMKQEEVMPFIVHPDSGLKIMATTPSWRTIRVFISSTFRDMHGERDLLTRFVFPELRSLGRNRFINIYEVDLRWGVTEEETKDNRTLDVCLQEVSRCQLFVGLLGERYGWIPDSYQVPEVPELAWVKDYPSGSSVTELEMHFGALSKGNEAKDTAFFYFRDNSFEKDVPQMFESDFKSESDMHKTKMKALKKKVMKSGLEVYDGYPCHWGGCVDGKPVVAGLEEFGARVLNTLANAITKLCPEEDDVLSEDEHINNLQWGYIKSSSTEFIGRKTLTNQIISQINSSKSGIIGLVGKPGSGKTALMASTIMQHVKSKQTGGSCSVLVNMAGSAPGSNSLTATLRRLAHQINTRFDLGYTLPEDSKNLTLKLKDLLEEAANVCTSRLVVFLDGIDQMDIANEPFSLEWMPQPVPDNVMFVISAVDGEKTHKSLKRLAAHEITIGELDMWDKADIVRQTLGKHHKSLNESGFDNQMKFLMLKKDAHNPLYLKLACEELRVFGVFEKISDKLKSLPHTTSQMLQEVLCRLEEDHGKNIVSVALCLLACARDGLYPEELLELINWHKQFDGSKFEPKDMCSLDLKNQIPPLRFTFLARSIMGFLNPSSTWASLLALANKEICTAVKLRYLKGTDTSFEIRLHKLLAGFFLRQADQHKNNTWQSQNARAFSELPYHLGCAANFHELEEILCNHDFIQSKCSLGLAATLMDDFTPKVNTNIRGHEKEVARFLSLPRVQQYKAFVSRNVDIFVNYPSLEWQQAMNEPSSSIPYKEAVATKQTRWKVPSYMQWSNKPETESQCYMTLSNFKLPVMCVTISPDCSKFAAGSQDLLVRLFDMGTGKELRFFTGHADQITDVCFVGNNMLCSASADTSLSIWDVENGHRIHTLKGHNRRVNTCASDIHGKLVASGGWDCTVYMWKSASGEKLCNFDIGSPVNCVDFHPSEEQIIVGSWDSLIRIYNYFHKTRIAILRGHSTSVRDIAYSFDGHHVASASLDGDIKIWAADKGSQVGNIRGHSGPINKLTFSPTGKELITAGDDHQIRVWSGDLGIPMHRLHTENFGAATSVSISSSGATVAVGYHLGQVKIYDVTTGVKLSKAKVCDSAVRTVTFSKDDAYIYAGCDDGYVQVLESNQGSKVCSLLGHTKPVLCVDTVETYIATCGEDFICCLYENIRQLKSSKVSSPKVVLRGHTAPVSACSFSADGTMLATASRDASVRVYKLHDVFISVDPEPAQVLSSCHADWINSCQWSNTGNFLVTASNDFNLKVWDMNLATEKKKIMGHTSAINTVTYKYGCIVSGSSDGDVKVWSHKGIPITTLSGHTLRVNSCDIYVKCKTKDNANVNEAPEKSWAEIASMEVDDSQEVKKSKAQHKDVNMLDVIVASAGDDGDVWIWKPLQANTLACLTGHSDRVLSVAADKHNNIASCSLDKTLRLWQPKLKDEINLSKHDAPVTFVSVANDNSAAISGSRDGVIKIWVPDAEKLFRMKYSFQAHEKSVNCGCYDGYAADRFVTGGDDNCIYVWELINRKDGFYVRKQSSFVTERPVASVTVNIINGLIYFTNWTGGIFCVSGKNKSQSIDLVMDISNGVDTCIKGWPGTILVHADTRELLVGTTCGFITRLGFNSNFSSLESNENISVPTDDVDADIPEFKRQPNWINCIAKSDGLIFAGDSRGQIFVRCNTFEVTMKIHRSAIMALEIVKGMILTGSTDCSIKVWTYTVSNTVQLTQVGQFFTPSPVTSLKAMPASQENGSISLLAGDQLGNIHQLCWWP